MNYNKSLKIKRAGGSMTPAKSAVPQRQGKGLIGRRKRLPQGHGRPTPGPRSPKTPFKGVQRDPRRGPKRDGGFRRRPIRRRRIRNRFTRK